MNIVIDLLDFDGPKRHCGHLELMQLLHKTWIQLENELCVQKFTISTTKNDEGDQANHFRLERFNKSKIDLELFTRLGTGERFILKDFHIERGVNLDSEWEP